MASTLFQTYNATSAQTGFQACNESYPVVGVTPSNYTNDGSPMTVLDGAAAGQVQGNGALFCHHRNQACTVTASRMQRNPTLASIED